MIVLFSWCFLDVFSIVMKDINEWSEITHLRLWGRFWQILTAGSQLACQLYYCQAISWGPSSSEWSQRNILGDMVRCLLNTLAFHHKSPCCVMPSSSRLLIALSFFWRLCRSPTFSRELLQCDSSRPCLQDLDLRKVWAGSCATSRTLAVWSVLSAFETRLPEGSLDRAVHHSVAQCTTSVEQQLQCMHRGIKCHFCLSLDEFTFQWGKGHERRLTEFGNGIIGLCQTPSFVMLSDAFCCQLQVGANCGCSLSWTMLFAGHSPGTSLWFLRRLHAGV